MDEVKEVLPIKRQQPKQRTEDNDDNGRKIHKGEEKREKTVEKKTPDSNNGQSEGDDDDDDNKMDERSEEMNEARKLAASVLQHRLRIESHEQQQQQQQHAIENTSSDDNDNNSPLEKSSESTTTQKVNAPSSTLPADDEGTDIATSTDQEWEEMYEHLEFYKQQNGHCLVPRSTARALTKWMDSQTRDYKLKKMRADRQERLDSIGFPWDAYEKEESPLKRKMSHEEMWHHMFSRLQQYKQQHGDCLVPVNFAQDIGLGRWVHAQRRAHKVNKLKGDRHVHLNAIGFAWDSRNKQNRCWMENFQRLQQYKAHHGDCCVPQNYTEDKALLSWVNQQRHEYKLKKLKADRLERLEAIGFLWNEAKINRVIKNKEKWDEMFQRLLRYKDKHGDCQVPADYSEDGQLSAWVLNQRSSKRSKSIRVDRKQKLDSIGFVWDIEDAGITSLRWEAMFKHLQRYKDQHGNCLVPQKYKDFPALGYWVSAQRTAYKSKKLAADLQQRLDSIGFVWKLFEPQSEKNWDELFNRLQRYKEQHGDCLVPRNYAEDLELSKWVRSQRIAHRYRKMNAHKQELLESLGFTWNINHNNAVDASDSERQDVKWNAMFHRLLAYKEKYGEDAVKYGIPERGVAADRPLRDWVKYQRRVFKTNKIKSDRQELLESVGFLWNMKDVKKESSRRISNWNTKWDEMLQRLESYKLQYGDCKVPEDFEDQALASWVAKQKRFCQKYTIRADRKKRLEAIGFEWRINKKKEEKVKMSHADLKWNEMFERLQRYKEQHGDCLVPQHYIGDRALGGWVGTQRVAHQHKKIKPERKKRLESLGFVFNPGEHKRQWEEMFERLQSYKQKYGDCRVPENFKDKVLSKWVQNQRYFNESKKLKPDRQERLESIGFFNEHTNDSSTNKKNPNRGKKANEEKWNEMFERLQRYKQKYGDCLVKQNCKDDSELGEWVKAQRRKYVTHALKRDRFDKLLSIGFIFKKDFPKPEIELNWDQSFQRLLRFKEKYGDCLVPKNYGRDRALGTWVDNQRRNYNLKTMYGEKQELLQSIGFVFQLDVNKEAWAGMFQRLLRYKQQYGNCLVPQDYSDDEALSLWVRIQRWSYKLEKIKPERQHRLDMIDFQWDVDESSDISVSALNWEEMFLRLLLYKETHGDCLVRQKYEGDKELTFWVRTQRRAYREIKMKLIRHKRLESVDFVWNDGSVVSKGKKEDDVKEESIWNNMFTRLKCYKHYNGNCMVPQHYNGDKTLGAWVHDQRRQYKLMKVSFDKAACLRSIGFIWDTGVTEENKEWNEFFERLQSYKHKHGDCLVPSDYLDVALFTWMQMQRCVFVLKKMRYDREQLLQSAGFQWNIDSIKNTSWVRDLKWQQMLLRLILYKEQYGNCLVPVKYTADKSHGKYELATWVCAQRKAYKTKKMQDDRQELLKSVGFIFDIENDASRDDMTWNEMFERLQRYKEKHGDCLVPQNFEDKRLVAWVGSQRYAYDLEMMRSNRQERLQSIGFVWDKEWTEIFERLKSYKHQHGDCLVSHNYVDLELATWVQTQRCVFNLKRMKADRQEQLESIGFEWDIDEQHISSSCTSKLDERWEKMFLRLLLHKVQHGDCLLPGRYPADQPLSDWVKTQKRAFKSKKMTGHRKERLEYIGFVF